MMVRKSNSSPLEMSLPRKMRWSYESKMRKEITELLNQFYMKGNFSPWNRSATRFKAKGRRFSLFKKIFVQGEGHDWNRA